MTTIFRTIALQSARILLKLAIDRTLQKELPKIFTQLDKDLPVLLFDKAKPLVVQAAITDAIDKNIGGIATRTQVAAVLSLYDPIQAAIRKI